MAEQLWRQCDPGNLETQIAEVLERYGAGEQIASDCADEVRGLLVEVAAGALLIEQPEQYPRVCINKRHHSENGSMQQHPVNYGWKDAEGRWVCCEGGPWAIIVPLPAAAVGEQEGKEQPLVVDMTERHPGLRYGD